MILPAIIVVLIIQAVCKARMCGNVTLIIIEYDKLIYASDISDEINKQAIENSKLLVKYIKTKNGKGINKETAQR